MCAVIQFVCMCVCVGNEVCVYGEVCVCGGVCASGEVNVYVCG